MTDRSESSLQRLSRSDWVICGVLMAVAALVRCVYYYQSLNWPYFDQPISDAAMYLGRARGLLEGSWPPPHTAHSQGPLYPYLLAVFLKTAASTRPVVVLQLLLGCLNAGLVYAITRRLAGPMASVVAAVLCLGYGPLVATEGKLLTESPSITLTLVAAWWAVGLAFEPNRLRAGGVGLMLGLSSALRPAMLTAIPLLIVWLIWRYRRRGSGLMMVPATLGAGAILIIAPFAIHNHRAEGEWIALSSAGGITFFLGNNPTAAGSLSLGGVITGEVATQHEEQLAAAEKVVGRRLTSGQASQFWYKRGLTFVRKYPRWWSWVLWRKLRLYFSNVELANVYAYEVERADVSVLRLLAIPFGLIVAVGVPGGLLAVRRPQAQPIVLLAALGLASCLIFYTSSRMRLPAVPFWAILGGYGIEEVFGWYRQGRRGAALGMAGLSGALLLATVLPVGGSIPSTERFGRRSLAHMLARDGHYDRARAMVVPQLSADMPSEDRSAAYVILGRIELEARRFQEALDALQTAHRLDPNDLPTRRYMTVAQMQLGRYSEAMEGAHAILAKNPRDIDARVLMADCLVRQRKWAEALDELEVVRRIVPDHAPAAFLYGQIYFAQHQYDKAAQEFRRAARRNPSPQILVNLAVCLMQMNQREEAIATLKQALEMEPDMPQAKAFLAELTGGSRR